MRKCSYIGCDRKHKAKGWCAKHYKRFMVDGDPYLKKDRREYGTGWFDPNGYKHLMVNGVPMLEHRYVWECHFGVKLGSDEIIHHKDGDKANNDISNLEKLNNQSEHIRHHNDERRREVANARGETDDTKFCTGCNKLLPISSFHKNPYHRRGFHTYCKICKAGYSNKKRKVA